MDYKGSVNRMNSKIKSDKTRVGYYSTQSVQQARIA